MVKKSIRQIVDDATTIEHSLDGGSEIVMEYQDDSKTGYKLQTSPFSIEMRVAGSGGTSECICTMRLTKLQTAELKAFLLKFDNIEISPCEICGRLAYLREDEGKHVCMDCIVKSLS